MLLDAIVDIIDKYRNKQDKLEKVINMSRREFKEIVGDKYSEELYQNRLLYLENSGSI
jgi:hypothetical protein